MLFGSVATYATFKFGSVAANIWLLAKFRTLSVVGIVVVRA